MSIKRFREFVNYDWPETTEMVCLCVILICLSWIYTSILRFVS